MCYINSCLICFTYLLAGAAASTLDLGLIGATSRFDKVQSPYCWTNSFCKNFINVADTDTDFIKHTCGWVAE